MKILAPIFAVVLASFTSPPWGMYPTGRNYWRAQQVNSGLVERAWVVYQSTSTVPAIKPFAFDQQNLTASKSWTSAIVTNFVRADLLPAFTNWTPATVIADCALPADYWTNTPFAGLSTASNGWGGMTAILARLTITATPGGCSTNCARTADMGLVTNGWNNGTLGSVCTNYGSWTWASNDNCALPGAASVVSDESYFADEVSIVYTLGYTTGPGCDPFVPLTVGTDTWGGCVGGEAPAYVPFITNGYFGCKELEASDFVRRIDSWTTNNALCYRLESLCLSRSSNPIGYAIPTTNTACDRIEYLAGGLPDSCGPSVFQTESISDGLSNGAWVVWSSNAAGVSPYYCDEDFISTNAPFGSCTTNAGWAVSAAKLVLHWDFDYK